MDQGWAKVYRASASGFIGPVDGSRGLHTATEEKGVTVVVTEVATDVRGHWAAPWILPVTRAGVMEIFSNHTFQPGSVVRRGDLAGIVYELLSLATVGNSAELERWAAVAPRFADLAPANLVYRAASTAVAAGVMAADGDRFGATRPVTGQELLAAVARVGEIANR